MHTVTRDGLDWVMHDGSGDNLGPAPHEEEFTGLLLDLLPERGVFLDVGAHVGHWTLRLAPKASLVIAVEANPETADHLRQNLALNQLDDKVQIVGVAAWHEHATVHLTDPNGQTAGGSTWASEGGDLPAAPLDDLIRPERIDLVKIDVEGAEAKVLAGMRRLLAEHSPVLFIEMHHLLHGEHIWTDTHRELEQAGYANIVQHGYGDQVHLLCRKG